MENVSPAVRSDIAPRLLQWSPIVLGAFAATALSSVLLTFGATIGLGVTSTAPTWRDASAALAILSGIYLILQAIVSFGLGGYVAGRVRTATGAAAVEDTERADGVHGLGVWSLAVILGVLLAALVSVATISRTPSMRSSAQASTAEPLLSYELDRLFRAGRRAANVDISAERAEAGRILLTTSSHSGLSADDRTYLIQQVGTLTGLSAADAERRVDSVVASAKSAITKSRRSSIILAFSVATAILLGAVAAWAAACAGGRHRDGAPLPEWMSRSDAIGRRETVMRQR
ncbi:hypothetical protein [Bradyrhizobium australiense]|uniref:Uncharacterized protein n=1 Tax=Bradyrhizobium australiense TaxID=2721161 RepID=A0A7Y4LY19_9BRAD|nr:hypothetical protein [Bradyrhizobium australiense]NOJ42270.1 hypothetical protein [Bradyrhizobium australiense]